MNTSQLTKLTRENRIEALKVLAETLGIDPSDHGWKTKLKNKLFIKNLNLLSTWIRRGFPKNMASYFKAIGVNIKVWDNIIANIHKETIPPTVLKAPAPGQLLPPASRDKDFSQAIRDLQDIFDSENQVLIKAIQANLCAFKYAAQAEKEKLEMQARMEKTIRRLEVENKELKGCAGGSPPFNLNPGNCAPSGTEDPKT